MFANALAERIRDVKKASARIDVMSFDVLAANLLFMHDAVVASERLLVEAAEAADLLPRSPFHDRLSAYFRSHLEEERGELKWLQEDLGSANITPGVPDPLAMAMVGTQYYLMKHVHPAALLGYMAVVEGDPVPVDVVRVLERTHGKQLLRFVRLHAIKDLKHREELFEVIDLSPPLIRGLVVHSAENTLRYLVDAARAWRTGSELNLREGLTLLTRLPAQSGEHGDLAESRPK